MVAGTTPVLVHNSSCDADAEGIVHAKARHLQSGDEWDSNAGYFDVGTDFEALSRGSIGKVGIRQENGNIKYVVRTGRVIGYDRVVLRPPIPLSETEIPAI